MSRKIPPLFKFYLALSIYLFVKIWNGLVFRCSLCFLVPWLELIFRTLRSLLWHPRIDIWYFIIYSNLLLLRIFLSIWRKIRSQTYSFIRLSGNSLSQVQVFVYHRFFFTLKALPLVRGQISESWNPPCDASRLGKRNLSSLARCLGGSLCVFFPIWSHNEVICLRRAGNCLARGVKPNGDASEGPAFLCYAAVKKTKQQTLHRLNTPRYNQRRQTFRLGPEKKRTAEAPRLLSKKLTTSGTFYFFVVVTSFMSPPPPS